MTKLPDTAIKDVARMAGFTGESLVTAIAIALAESGGNPQAINHNRDKNQTTDRGLWQINNYWHKEVSDAVAYDPTQAAAAVYAISRQGSNWSAWSSFKSGAYLLYVSRAKAAVALDVNVKPQPPSGTYDESGNPVDTTGGYKNPDTTVPDIHNVTIPNPLDWVAPMSNVLGWLTNADNWRKIGLVVAGAIAILVGFAVIRADSLVKVAPEIAKVAAVVK